MAVYTGPKYGTTDFDASRWRDLYSNLFGTGVIQSARVQGAAGGDLAASATTGLGWSVATGVALIKGFACIVDTSAVTGTLAAADPSLPRIDTLVLSWAYSSGVGTLSVVAVTGTPASSPVAPTLTQNDTAFQLPLADCRVNAAATTIASVTDRRAYCSVVGNFLSSSGGTITGNLTVAGTLFGQSMQVTGRSGFGGSNPAVTMLSQNLELWGGLTGASPLGTVFHTYNGTSSVIPFSVGGQFQSALAWIDNSGAGTFVNLSWGAGVGSNKSLLSWDGAGNQNVYWTPQAGATALGHTFVTWSGTAQVDVFSLGGRFGASLTWIDNSGNYNGPIGGGIPTTRNGAALSVPIYTGATTPSSPPTGSVWAKA